MPLGAGKGDSGGWGRMRMGLPPGLPLPSGVSWLQQQRSRQACLGAPHAASPASHWRPLPAQRAALQHRRSTLACKALFHPADYELLLLLEGCCTDSGGQAAGTLGIGPP